MSFFIAKNETTLDILTDTKTLMRTAPDYYRPRLDAIADLRSMDDGTLHCGNEFRRVASLVNVPLLEAMKLCDPEFLSNKQRFYAWLKKHPEYKTYDTRGGQRLSETYVDGKAVL